jgi:curli biogenesis system outer membrane secretion channel CsgG
MRKIVIFTVLAFVLSLSCSGTQKRYTGAKQLIPVPAFVDITKTSISKKVIDSLTDKFTTELAKNGRFSVVERSRLNEILKEHELTTTGLISESNAVKLGKLVQAPFIVLGTINQMNVTTKSFLDDTVLGYSKATIKITLTVRVISTTTGASVGAAETVHEGTKSNLRMGLDSSTQFVFGDSAVDNDNPIHDEILAAATELAEELYNQNF